VVPPPANIRRPSGTKTHLLIYVDNNETSPWHLPKSIRNGGFETGGEVEAKKAKRAKEAK